MTEDKKKNKSKSGKWMKFRHRVVYALLFLPMAIAMHLMFNLKINRLKGRKGRQLLVIANHQTPFDQFFLELVLPGRLYFIASEDIFSKGWVSALLRYAVAPIPIQKSTSDFRAVRNCFKVAREGGSIAIFPEGNRTYSGRTETVKPSVVALMKALKLPIAVVKIEGGYGAMPRWSDRIRRNRITVGVSRIIEPEEYKGMSDGELFELVSRELYVDDSADHTPIRDKRGAEFLERALYVCPDCGITDLESRGDRITCKKCGKTVIYSPDRYLRGEGFEFPFKTVAEWYDYQNDFMNSLDISPYSEEPLFSDEAEFIEVVVYKEKRLLSEKAVISGFSDRLEVRGGGVDMTFPYSEIKGATAVGRNKINFYHGDKVYQIKSTKGDKRLCALKYMNLYYHAENIRKEEENAKFLGL